MSPPTHPYRCEITALTELVVMAIPKMITKLYLQVAEEKSYCKKPRYLERQA